MRGKANLIGRAMMGNGGGMGDIPGAPAAMGGDEPDADDMGGEGIASGGPPAPQPGTRGISGPAKKPPPTAKRAPPPPAKSKKARFTPGGFKGK